MWLFKKAVDFFFGFLFCFFQVFSSNNKYLKYLLGVVLGDSLGAFRHGVLGKFTRKDETDSSLDLSARDGRLLVVARKAASLRSKALKDVMDKVVHDHHALLRDAGVRVHLLEHLVDVRGVPKKMENKQV